MKMTFELLWHDTECNMGNSSDFPNYATYFRSLLASEIIPKYEKREKYLSILHEATCDDYFINRYLLKSSVPSVTLHINCIKLA